MAWVKVFTLEYQDGEDVSEYEIKEAQRELYVHFIPQRTDDHPISIRFSNRKSYAFKSLRRYGHIYEGVFSISTGGPSFHPEFTDDYDLVVVAMISYVEEPVTDDVWLMYTHASNIIRKVTPQPDQRYVAEREGQILVLTLNAEGIKRFDELESNILCRIIKRIIKRIEGEFGTGLFEVQKKYFDEFPQQKEIIKLSLEPRSWTPHRSA